MLCQNPCKDTIIPSKEKRQAIAFSDEEQKKFIACCQSHTVFEDMFVFAFYTGLRLGELQALSWSDINNDSTITVSKSLAVVNDYDNSDKKNKLIINTPKTSNSKRIVPLSRKALEIIEERKNQNDGVSPFVFCSSNGTPLSKRSVYRAFKAILNKAGIDSPVTIHSLRHSFAARLLEKGADIKTTSELLGHKSIQITLDIYSHVSENLKTKTINLLDE